MRLLSAIRHLRFNIKYLGTLLVLGFITGLLVSAVFSFLRTPSIPQVYSQTYQLVSDKISQDAPIVINLPKGISKKEAYKNITFEPEIQGRWLKTEAERQVVFKPSQKLIIGHYYTAKLTIPDGGVIAHDFLIDENPAIIAIFPKQNSEAPEDSKITIVFNRPMVALTTLDKMEQQDVPVEITPQTAGRFKWISTRTLQFIPKERLQRSSHYQVRIRPGLHSMDGLPVKEETTKFTTRQLRYQSITGVSFLEGPPSRPDGPPSGFPQPKGNPRIIYNQPISIYFNQPVDLAKTKQAIKVLEVETGKNVPFIAEYGTKKKKVGAPASDNLLAKVSRKLSALMQGKTEEVTDKSVIRIYNQSDRFGRAKLWDFNKAYRLEINRAYPAEGDIFLNQARSTFVQVTGVIKDISATSERTTQAAADFFDPQGKLWIEFYEEIDKDRSQIFADKLKTIGYGEKCQDGSEISEFSSCKKVDDKTKIFLEFQEDKISRGESLTINLRKVVNQQGLQINPQPIKQQVLAFPNFQVLRTVPGNNTAKASLTDLTICSNSPVAVPAPEDRKKWLKTSRDYEISYWGRSYRIQRPSRYNQCQVGEFETRIKYGLMPLSDYQLQLELQDVFGQKTTHSLSLSTGQMPNDRLDFFHFQNTYNVTSPDNTKLTFAAVNWETVNLHICKLSAFNFLTTLERSPRFYEPPSSVAGCQRVVVDQLTLPPKFWVKNFFAVDLKQYFDDIIGHYIITLFNPSYTRTYWNSQTRQSKTAQAYERSYLTVTNLAVIEKKIRPSLESPGSKEPVSSASLQKLGNLYWVTDLSSSLPVENAAVKLYQSPRYNRDRLVQAGVFTTNPQGIAKTPGVYNLKAAIVETGKDSTILPSRESTLQFSAEALAAQKVYLYTDRPIYRPAHKVFIKGIYRLGYDGSYSIPVERPINLKIYNSKNEVVSEKELRLSDYGTFDTELLLDPNAPLGLYRYCVNQYACGTFDVQEFKPAPFEVKVTSEQDEYVSKDTVQLAIEAQYFFGVPVKGGEVDYTISSQNFYFDRFTDEYFDFGASRFFEQPFQYGDKFLMRGKTELSQNGKSQIKLNIDLEQLFQNQDERGSKLLIFDVTVKNSQGQSVSAQKSVVVHAGQFYLGLKSDQSFAEKGQPITIRAKSVDIQGQPRSVQGIEFKLYKVKWVQNKRLGPGGSFNYQWEKQQNLKQDFTFGTNRQGDFSRQLMIQEAGNYEAEISAQDNRGNHITSQTNLYIAGPGQISVRPLKNTGLEVQSEQEAVEVGKTARIIIQSPYQKAKALISLERGQLFDYTIKPINGNVFSYEFPVKPEYAPNIFVSVTLLAMENNQPKVRFGKTELQVNSEQKNLKIEAQADKKFYLPGEKVTLDITTTDAQGQPVASELSLAVVDLSVLALKGNPKKNPAIFFYDGFPLAVTTSSNIKNFLQKQEYSRTKGGGGGPEELARKKRGEFRETAFWAASVRTNQQGKTRVSFTLPDNLTRWQLESVGITKDTKVGVDYDEFTTRKKLMAVPIKPRFIVPGDEFQLGATVFNQTGQDRQIKVALQKTSLEVIGNKQSTIHLAPEESQTIFFKVKAPRAVNEGRHQFTISAQSQSLIDIVEQSIAITPNNTFETTATANFTQDQIAKEYVFLPENIVQDKGKLTVKSSATLAVFLSDALNELLEFPYGCAEQSASRINAIATIQRGLQIPNIRDKFNLKPVTYRGQQYSLDELVQVGLTEILNKQTGNGGFAYWAGSDSNFYLTLHVVNVLGNLSNSGYQVSEKNLQRALQYIERELRENPRITADKQAQIIAAYTLSRFKPVENFLIQKVVNLASNENFIQDQASHTTLLHLALLFSSDNFPVSSNLKDNIFKVLANRIEIDSRGAFLGLGKNKLWQFYETPIKNTALYLKALVADKRTSPLQDRLLRWLLNSRAKDGSWGSTNNTITVIDALTDFLVWKKETQSNYQLKVSLNQDLIGSFTFAPDTILEQFKKEVPISRLPRGQNNHLILRKQAINNAPNTLYYDVSLRYFLPLESIPPRDEGFTIEQNFYTLDDEQLANPVQKAKVGQVLRGHLVVTVPKDRKFVAIEDFIPAGMELVNLNLETAQKSLRFASESEQERFDNSLRPDFQELRDDRVFLFKEQLSPGVYEFDYFVRALVKGTYNRLPARAFEMYFPENFGSTAGEKFTIEPQ